LVESLSSRDAFAVPRLARYQAKPWPAWNGAGKNTFDETAVDQRSVSWQEQFLPEQLKTSSSELVEQVCRQPLSLDAKVKSPKPMAVRRGIEEVNEARLLPDVHIHLLDQGLLVDVNSQLLVHPLVCRQDNCEHSVGVLLANFLSLDRCLGKVSVFIREPLPA
jgi:hypothetical protein